MATKIVLSRPGKFSFEFYKLLDEKLNKNNEEKDNQKYL